MVVGLAGLGVEVPESIPAWCGRAERPGVFLGNPSRTAAHIRQSSRRWPTFSTSCGGPPTARRIMTPRAESPESARQMVPVTMGARSCLRDVKWWAGVRS